VNYLSMDNRALALEAIERRVHSVIEHLQAGCYYPHQVATIRYEDVPEVEEFLRRKLCEANGLNA
jgi:hypothetical protein